MDKETRGVIVGSGFILAFIVLIQFLAMLEGDSDDIYLSQIEQAFEVCENNGGLYMIDGELFKSHKFLCRNGATFVYDDERDPISVTLGFTNCTDNLGACLTPKQMVELEVAKLPNYCRADYVTVRSTKQEKECIALYIQSLEETK